MTRITKVLRVVLSVAMLASVVPGTLPVAAQSTTSHVASSGHVAADIKAPPATGRVDAASIKVNKRPPIAFAPFEMRDQKTGKPIPPDEQITLANGKRMTVRQYFDQINDLEKKLNSNGFSLRQPSAKDAPMQEGVVPHALLQQQTQRVLAAHQPGTAAQPFNIRSAEREHNSLPTLRLEQLKGITLVKPPKKVNYGWSWGWGVGDPALFATNIDIKLSMDGVKAQTGTATSVDVAAEAKAGGSIFNNAFDILRVTGNMHAADTGALNGKLDVFVLGNNIYSLSKTGSAKLYKSDNVSKSLDKAVHVDFPLGPIPFSATVGIQGTAGVGYVLSVAPIAARLSGGPFVRSKAYAQVAVDIDIARAGVEGDLTLLDYGLNLDGEVSFGIDPANKPYFKTHAEVSQNMKMLGGELYAFAEACVPCGDFGSNCGFPFFSCDEKWRLITFFNWKGFEYNGVLLNFNKNNYI
jgi:hypothetical protein